MIEKVYNIGILVGFILAIMGQFIGIFLANYWNNKND